jgi:beta-lactamase regulating signal transducer with metallopeptidase domain
MMNMPLWFPNLIFWSAQVALLVLAAGILQRLLRLRQPRVLLVYWRSLLAVSLLLPLLQPWHRLPSVPTIIIPADFPGVVLPPPTTPPVSQWYFPSVQVMAQFLGIIILAGIGVRLAILALGLLKLGQFRRTSSPISESSELVVLLEAMRARVNARAEFRLSASVDSPVTFGFSSPVVLLPERFPALDARFQSAIACHELLHVRRHDWAHHLAEEFLRSTFWFHPAISWLISRIRLAGEQVVDLEVVKLTQARKPYLEALLEFTNARAPIAAIPAPPFLAERQLVERVSLMLKEVRMSRRALIASLTVISCCLALVVAFAAWAFPLKAAPRTRQGAPQTGTSNGVSGGVSGGVPGVVAQGASGGVAGGVSGGIGGGISGEVAKSQHTGEPNVDYSTIWIDTVKRGPMIRHVRGLGTLVRAEGSSDLVARVTLPESMAADLRLNQNATVDLRPNLNVASGTPIRQIKGSVIRVTPSGQTRTVDITLNASRQFGFTAGLQVDATIDIEKLDNILQIGRPAQSAPNSTSSLFKIVNDGTEAVRVNVKFGRASVNTIEVLDGLQASDKVILSDMSSVENADRIHLTDEQHVRKQ